MLLPAASVEVKRLDRQLHGNGLTGKQELRQLTRMGNKRYESYFTDLKKERKPVCVKYSTYVSVWWGGPVIVAKCEERQIICCLDGHHGKKKNWYRSIMRSKGNWWEGDMRRFDRKTSEQWLVNGDTDEFLVKNYQPLSKTQTSK